MNNIIFRLVLVLATLGLAVTTSADVQSVSILTNPLSKNGLKEIEIIKAIPAGNQTLAMSKSTNNINLFMERKPKDSDFLNKAYFHLKEKCSSLPDAPKTLKDLTGGFKIFSSSVSESAAVSADIIGLGDVTGKKSAFVQILQYAQIGERYCKTDYGTYPVNFGVGSQANLHIKKIDGSVNLSQIPTLAATVQLGKSEIKFSMTTLGLTGEKVNNALPKFNGGIGDFDVDNYAKMIASIDEVRLLTYNKETIVVPQLIITEKVIQEVASEMIKRAK
ncbi:TPA: hypothetical protein JI121_02415 [Acinetobacter baumannii]|nr:hypothetical protein [Acinetobacter baumannii]